MIESGVNPVHQLYMDISGRYKAGWTFHRFIQGLRKFFGSQELEDHTADFQQLYSGLREVSKRLNDPDIQSVISTLTEHRETVDALLKRLDKEDQRVDPSLVRLFFQRVKTYDERILLDLIRFYLEVQAGRSWKSERIDKVDYLLTRLGEAVAGPRLGGDRSRLARVLGGLSGQVSRAAEVDPQKIANRQKMVQAVRSEVQQLEIFEQLTERDLVSHYRHLKHGLGNLLFEESILPVIVDTNLLLAARVQDLAREEEKRILEDYEKVSRLEQEGSVDRQLTDSVNRLHLQVSRFRKQIDAGDVRLQDMAQIRQSVIDILARVEETAPPEKKAPVEHGGKPDVSPLSPDIALPSELERKFLAGAYRELIAILGESAVEDGEERQLDARAQSYRLESRELAAYDRLSAGAPCDDSLESFVLAGAALRQRINEEVNEIHSYRSRVGGREATSADSTRSILRLGDLYLRRFSHYLEGNLLDGDSTEAHALQMLRMRLMRDYSGLWLVAHG